MTTCRILAFTAVPLKRFTAAKTLLYDSAKFARPLFHIQLCRTSNDMRNKFDRHQIYQEKYSRALVIKHHQSSCCSHQLKYNQMYACHSLVMGKFGPGQFLPKTQKLCQNIKIAEELKVLYRFAIITQIMKNKVDRVKVAAEVALLLNLPFCPYLTWRSPRG